MENYAKGTGSQEISNLVMHGDLPDFFLPGPDDMDENGQRKFLEGATGVEECAYVRKKTRYAKEEFERALPRLVATVYSSISNVILDRIKLDPEYAAAYLDDDIVKIMELAKFASTGEGSASVFQTVTTLLNLKIRGDDFVTYFSKFLEYRHKIKTGRTDGQVVKLVFDSIFVMGARNYAPLQKKIDEILGLPVWPSADTSIAKWTQFLTIKNAVGEC